MKQAIEAAADNGTKRLANGYCMQPRASLSCIGSSHFFHLLLYGQRP